MSLRLKVKRMFPRTYAQAANEQAARKLAQEKSESIGGLFFVMKGQNFYHVDNTRSLGLPVIAKYKDGILQENKVTA